MSSSLRLLKSTVDPLTFPTLPPYDQQPNTFLKSVDIVCNVVIEQEVVNSDPHFITVSNKTGAFVWYFGHSVNTVVRYGIVPSGSVDSCGDLVYVNANQRYAPSLVYSSGCPLPFTTAVTINESTTIIPPNTNGVITISPTMTDLVLSLARTVGGYLTLQNGSLPVGNTPLTGTCTAVGINDVRNVFIAPTTNAKTSISLGVVPPFTYFIAYPSGVMSAPSSKIEPLSSDLLANMVLDKKDIVSNVQIASDGICVTVGPDIFRNLAPVSETADQPFGDWQTYSIEMQQAIGDPGYPPGVPVPNPYNTQYVYAGWYSPYNIGVYDPDALINNPSGINSDGSQSINWQVINFGTINPMGGVDFEATYYLQANTGGQPDGYLETYSFAFLHIYAALRGDGSVYYSHTADQEAFTSCISFAGGTSNTGLPMNQPIIVRSSCKPYQPVTTGGTTVTNFVGPTSWDAVVSNTGIYVGTQHFVLLTIGGIAANPGSYTAQVAASCQIKIRPRNIYQPGELSARILQYENVGYGQSLILRGKVMCECMPGQDVAPFIQQYETDMIPRCLNLNVYPFLHEIYRDPKTPFRRCYRVDEYDRARAFVHKLRIGQIKQYALSNARIDEAAQNAGILKRKYEEDDEPLTPIPGFDPRALSKQAEFISVDEARKLHARLKNLDKMPGPVENPKIGKSFSNLD